MTSYHAVVGRGGVKEGTKIGLIGIGGLGSVGNQIAAQKGAKVYVALLLVCLQYHLSPI